MATVLYRLGRFSHRRRWVVLAAWALILVVAGIGATTLSGPMSNSFTIPGTESQTALDLMNERIPQSNADAASARVVFTGPVTRPAIEPALAALAELPHVATVTDPFTTKSVSADGRTAFSTVTYTVGAADLTPADQQRLFAAGRAPGLTVHFGGEAVQGNADTGGVGEGIGIAVAAVVLVVTFGSLLAAGMPLLTAVVGVGLGLAGITTVSGFVHLAATTTALASMLGLAVGIDYALFIVSRYRHELLAGHDPDDAAGRAAGTAGSAVVFAGATVIIALVALTVVRIPFLAQMGLGAAATVLIAVVVALTLLPALLGLLGPRVLGRRRGADRAARDPEAGTPVPEPMGARWARFVVRRRWPLAVLVVAGLGVVALPALDLRLALPSDATAAPDSTQRQAYDALARGFGPGFNGPLLVAADLRGASAAATAQIGKDLAALPGTAAVAPPTVVDALALYTLIPASGPDDEATTTLVHAIRSHAAGWASATGAHVYVTGQTAIGIDVSQRLDDALLPYLAVVVGLAFLLLMLVFRSLVVPLKATLGFLLSLAATFGAVVTVFQNGHLAGLFGVRTQGPILSFLPILVIGILFGLAMDYEVFLVTRMREEHVHGASAQEAVVHGFRHGARVVTAAAIIMTSVFAGFLLTDDAIIKSLGFAMATGVLFDAFLVRMTLVPAVMSLLGRAAWMIPARLDRLLPDVDVEGERLTELLAGGMIPAPRVHADVPERA